MKLKVLFFIFLSFNPFSTKTAYYYDENGVVYYYDENDPHYSNDLYLQEKQQRRDNLNLFLKMCVLVTATGIALDILSKQKGPIHYPVFYPQQYHEARFTSNVLRLIGGLLQAFGSGINIIADTTDYYL